MKRSIRCYNSGKISGLTYLTAVKNFEESDKVIREMNLIPVSPIEKGLKPSRPYWLHIIWDLCLLLTCKNIYFQRNWEESKGARIEYRAAKLLGMDMWFETNPGCE